MGDQYLKLIVQNHQAVIEHQALLVEKNYVLIEHLNPGKKIAGMLFL